MVGTHRIYQDISKDKRILVFLKYYIIDNQAFSDESIEGNKGAEITLKTKELRAANHRHRLFMLKLI